jgi:hypothetical protein
MTTFANDCSFLKGPDDEWSKMGLKSTDQTICEALTDKNVNQGRPLNILQLEEVRRKISEPYQKDKIFDQVALASIDKKVDCMIATGDYKICHCLSNKLPWMLSYRGYLSIVTSSEDVTAEAFQISQSDFLKLSGIVWTVRDACLTSPD